MAAALVVISATAACAEGRASLVGDADGGSTAEERVSAAIDEASKTKSLLDQSPFSFDRMAYERISRPIGDDGEIVACRTVMGTYQSQLVKNICSTTEYVKFLRLGPSPEDVSKGYYGSCKANLSSLAKIFPEIHQYLDPPPSMLGAESPDMRGDLALNGSLVELKKIGGIVSLQFEGPAQCLFAITSIEPTETKQ
jgi:hypothetical protein